jgi:hypothetical protein
MKVSTPASGWLPSGWWDRMPVHMSHTVTIIVLLQHHVGRQAIPS